MKNKICSKCGALTTNGTNRCSSHQRVAWESAQRMNTDFYNTSEWRHLREQSLIRDKNTCVKCGAHKGLQIHHIIPPRGDMTLFYCLDNLTTMCATCHYGETQREIKLRHQRDV